MFFFGGGGVFCTRLRNQVPLWDDWDVLTCFVYRLFAKLGRVLEYHLATIRRMACHPNVHSVHKALSEVKRMIPSLIILLKTNQNDQTRRP